MFLIGTPSPALLQTGTQWQRLAASCLRLIKSAMRNVACALNGPR
jgi:hypothetical protein